MSNCKCINTHNLDGRKFVDITSPKEAELCSTKYIKSIASHLGEYTLPNERCLIYVLLGDEITKTVDTRFILCNYITKKDKIFQSVPERGQRLYYCHDPKKSIVIHIRLYYGIEKKFLTTSMLLKRSNTKLEKFHVIVKNNEFSKSKRRCGICNKPSCKQKCGRCKKVYYCSKFHQKLDWESVHKSMCKK